MRTNVDQFERNRRHQILRIGFTACLFLLFLNGETRTRSLENKKLIDQSSTNSKNYIKNHSNLSKLLSNLPPQKFLNVSGTYFGRLQSDSTLLNTHNVGNVNTKDYLFVLHIKMQQSVFDIKQLYYIYGHLKLTTTNHKLDYLYNIGDIYIPVQGFLLQSQVTLFATLYQPQHLYIIYNNNNNTSSSSNSSRRKRRNLVGYTNILKSMHSSQNTMPKSINTTKPIFIETKLTTGVFTIVTNQNLSTGTTTIDGFSSLRLDSLRYLNMIRTLPIPSSRIQDSQYINSSIIGYLTRNPLVIKLSGLCDSSSGDKTTTEPIYYKDHTRQLHGAFITSNNNKLHINITFENFYSKVSR